MRIIPNKLASLPCLLSILLLASFTTEGTSMSLFSQSREIVLASPMEGLLTHEGKPLPGVKIERKLRWYDGEESTEDFVVTDKDGRFTFPIVKKVLKVSGYVHFVVSQEISAIYRDEEIIIWALGKSSKIEYGELGGKPVNLRCELTSDKQINRDHNTPLMTRCTWDSLEPWVDTEHPI